MSPGTGTLRSARVLCLAVLLVGLSVVSHQLAGGDRPRAVPLVVLTALTFALVRPLTRRQVGLPRLLGLLGAGQLGLHVAFERFAALEPVFAGPVHHHGTASDGWMLAAHALTTVVVALVVRHGDALLWRVWTWLTRRRLPVAPALHLVAVALRAHRALWSLHGAASVDAVRARAPPLPV